MIGTPRAELGSQLPFRSVAPVTGPEAGLLVLLHGFGGNHDDLVPLARAGAPSMRLSAPQALNQSFIGRRPNGHFWYRQIEWGDVEPDSLEVAIAHLESALEVWTHRSAGGPVILLGTDQGAVCALVLAILRPDLVDGVASIRGFLPAWLHSESAPLLERLDVFLAYDPLETGDVRSRIATTRLRLIDQGAAVVTIEVIGCRERVDVAVPHLTAWVENVLSAKRCHMRAGSPNSERKV